MMAIRIRRDVWKLDEADPILIWYGRAIEVMKSRPPADPANWSYQAAIHRQLGPSIPGVDVARFWTQCQHGSWFFLPWHRMYLAYFEQIVATIIADLGGPGDWALPYWNYSDPLNPNARKVPPAFRSQQIPGTTQANHLWIAQRNPDCNAGHDIAVDQEVDIAALKKPLFSTAIVGGDPGFGGPQTDFQHSSGIRGALELVPHGSMHGAVGGFMGSFSTAGLDPLFWLHHANIDRLWSVWRKREPAHLDPTLARWLSGTRFYFHDAVGNTVSHTASDVVDTRTTPPLNYEYEDESDPFAGLAPLAGAAASMTAPVAEMVGASAQAIELIGRAIRADVPLRAPVGPLAGSVAEPTQIYLNVENVIGTTPSVSYAVYINLPAGEAPELHPELYAGLLPMFGIEEVSRVDDIHSGSGLQFSLDVTTIVNALRLTAGWNPNNLQVSFVPTGVQARRALLAMTPVDTPTVKIGRLSLYFA